MTPPTQTDAAAKKTRRIRDHHSTYIQHNGEKGHIRCRPSSPTEPISTSPLNITDFNPVLPAFVSPPNVAAIAAQQALPTNHSPIKKPLKPAPGHSKTGHIEPTSNQKTLTFRTISFFERRTKTTLHLRARPATSNPRCNAKNHGKKISSILRPNTDATVKASGRLGS